MHSALLDKQIAGHGPPRTRKSAAATSILILAAVALSFAAVSGQLVRLAWNGQNSHRLDVAEPIVHIWARPDMVDRRGRLIATDLQFHSLYADPAMVLDPDEAAERLGRIFSDIDVRALRAQLADRSRRFVWIKRALPPSLAQTIHDLGFPGLAFRTEPKRAYPQGRLAGHVLGSVNIDNKGMSGLERHIDEALGMQSGLAGDIERPPVTLSLDLGVQHGVEEELSAAMARFSARAAAGIMMDVDTGEVVAAVSLPDVDPGRPAEAQEPDRMDRLQVATYELGSVFKVVTVAMAMELGLAQPSTVIDVRVPVQVGRWTIRDLHPSGRPLTMREVLVRSSNVGATKLALMAGPERQRAFLQRIGLLDGISSEAGSVTAPVLPSRWTDVEAATIGFGHGIAIAPMQFAAVAAGLVNGGYRVSPTFLRSDPSLVRAAKEDRERVVSDSTSRRVRELMRNAVTMPGATGRRADVPGYEVGGKTGTAEIAGRGGYRAKAVVASFLAAFPMRAPRYLLLVSLIEPKPAAGTHGHITAGVNAAPVAASIIARAAPLLGVAPQRQSP
jgi:cell division protein FtsI (penicillin-binding protein 3)